MTTFFTSDTHFGDPRVLRIDRRPFPSIPAHDAALVERWNAAVAPEDDVWHLGDSRSGPPRRASPSFWPGSTAASAFIGNNDGSATLDAPGWAGVQHYAETT